VSMLIPPSVRVSRQPDEPILDYLWRIYTEEQIGSFRIAKRLNEEGIPTRRGLGPWTYNSVESALKVCRSQPGHDYFLPKSASWRSHWYGLPQP
jgi:hypothetical protein